MEHSSASHRLQLDQLNTGLVTNELTSNMKHDGTFSDLDVIPTESQNLASSKTKRECDHISAFMTMSFTARRKIFACSGVRLRPSLWSSFGPSAIEATLRVNIPSCSAMRNARRRVDLAILFVAGE